MLIEKEDFMKKYNLDVDLINQYQINWSELEAIYKDFVIRKEQLEVYSNLLAELLRKQSRVHTVRSRIKDPEHLIAKLIRKTPDRKQQKGDEFHFTVDNYRSEITDLIGVRVIHIFKEDWKDIHKFIDKNWSIKELQVNIREGDDRNIYEEQKIPIKYRETGYRSVHYLIEFSPTNELLTAEIQVRTIFEEGYGEIDHLLSYPNNNVPEVLTLNLLMLNRLAGSADEMSSVVRTIKEEWGKMQDQLDAKDDEVKKLKNKIEKLNIESKDKESLFEGIGKISGDNNWINNIGDTIYSINDATKKIRSDWEKGITNLNTNQVLKVDQDWNKGITNFSTDGIFNVNSDLTKGITSFDKDRMIKISDSSTNGVDSNYEEENTKESKENKPVDSKKTKGEKAN